MTPHSVHVGLLYDVVLVCVCLCLFCFLFCFGFCLFCLFVRNPFFFFSFLENTTNNNSIIIMINNTTHHAACCCLLLHIQYIASTLHPIAIIHSFIITTLSFTN